MEDVVSCGIQFNRPEPEIRSLSDRRDKLKNIKSDFIQKTHSAAPALSTQEDKPYGRDSLFLTPHILETRDGRRAPRMSRALGGH